MPRNDPFRLELSEDESLSVEFSHEFVSLSHAEQIETLEAFFWKKMQEPAPTQDVNKAMAQHEMTIIFAESFLAKLKRGERLDNDADIDLSLEDLMSPGTLADSAVMLDMEKYLDDEAED